MRKVLPCALVAAVTVSTTPVNEFMSAMCALRLPRQMVIPLTIMLRYVPTVRADWASIRDAMRLRGVGPGPIGLLHHPVRTIDCVYVPLLMSASTAADELSMAAVARGIENPARRTCYAPIGFTPADVLAAAPGVIALVLAVVVRVAP
ncbi:energy-coupling factor transporter transmembrane component T [Propionibacterium australiense]|uniref:Cobalt transport protein n=1 Tax=Propionibacterium australiense TaxID=119981 RepID=A0A383S5C1_9ACTN|nr:energy-coupling factor transporter transmembrane component T [Propionibacterium australiense]SYZ33195.1 Cobalt transport protein [Propionibacterium australiense]VEH89351.1 Energy-coupling factor transporter transmembrane protein EcfT [Propionibacterium australiense]